MKWITRERPKIDRLACPWLIKNFIDKDAEFFFVPENEVLAISEKIEAIPFDIPNTEYSHYEDKVTFDYFLKKHNLTEPALHKIAIIVCGTNTDRHDLAPEVAGLWAITASLSYNIQDDFKLLEIGFLLYDGLYSWAKYLYAEKHLNNNPFETLPLDFNVFNQPIYTSLGKKTLKIVPSREVSNSIFPLCSLMISCAT